MYVDSLDLEQQFVLSDMKLQDLPGILNGSKGEYYQKQAASNFITSIKTTGIMTTKISLSYFQCVILVLLLLYLAWLYGKKYLDKKQTIGLGITFFIGSIGYAFVMLVLYIFNFGPVEGPNLASFNRYMPTYILIGISVVIMLFVYAESKNNKNDS